MYIWLFMFSIRLSGPPSMYIIYKINKKLKSNENKNCRKLVIPTWSFQSPRAAVTGHARLPNEVWPKILKIIKITLERLLSSWSRFYVPCWTKTFFEKQKPLFKVTNSIFAFFFKKVTFTVNRSIPGCCCCCCFLKTEF